MFKLPGVHATSEAICGNGNKICVPSRLFRRYFWTKIFIRQTAITTKTPTLKFNSQLLFAIKKPYRLSLLSFMLQFAFTSLMYTSETQVGHNYNLHITVYLPEPMLEMYHRARSLYCFTPDRSMNLAYHAIKSRQGIFLIVPIPTYNSQQVSLLPDESLAPMFTLYILSINILHLTEQKTE